VTNRLLLFCFILLPLAFFSIKAFGVELTFFRLLLIPLTISFAIHIVFIKKFEIIVVKVLSNEVIILILIYIGFSLIMLLYTFYSYENNLALVRGVNTFIAHFSYLLLFPVIATSFLLFNSRKNFLFNLSYWWYVLLLWGLGQAALYVLFDLSLAPEDLLNFNDQNYFNISGFNMIRINSFFGEPRRYAGMILSIIFFYRYMNGYKKLIKQDYIVIFLMGFLTGSVTFLVVILLTMGMIFLLNSTFSQKIYLLLSATLIVFILILLVPENERFSSYLLDLQNGSIHYKSDLYYQASDWLVIFYLWDILNGSYSFFNVIFGNGLGSFNNVINEYYILWFGVDILNSGYVVNSRLIIFNIFVELGLLGVFLFFKIFLKIYFLVTKHLDNGHMLKNALIGFFAGSMVSGAYVFVALYAIILFLIMRNNYEYTD
jgi:hypothetical protein